MASLTTTVAAGAEGRFAVSDCDGHKRTESTHVENHFEQVCLQLHMYVSAPSTRDSTMNLKTWTFFVKPFPSR